MVIFLIKGTRVNGGEEETMVYLMIGKLIVGEREIFRQNLRCSHLLTRLDEVFSPPMTGQRISV